MVEELLEEYALASEEEDCENLGEQALMGFIAS